MGVESWKLKVGRWHLVLGPWWDVGPTVPRTAVVPVKFDLCFFIPVGTAEGVERLVAGRCVSSLKRLGFSRFVGADTTRTDEPAATKQDPLGAASARKYF